VPVWVGAMSRLGLVELTRQRRGPTLSEVMTQACATCGGAGRIPADIAGWMPLSRAWMTTSRHGPSRDADHEGKKAAPGCPICGAPSQERHRPFCSKRCADIDLARWLNESYRVPGEPANRPAESEESEEN
jgi:endogenous inhibitor of DNA gyrase (YacG/DUF329 family)